MKKNFSKSMCELIKSYLADKTFKVNVGNHYSDEKSIGAGVPQGSVIGPTLYLLFTSDMPVSNDSFTALFADDTAVAVRHKDYNTAVEQLQKSLNRISRWAKRWKIAINKSKSTRVDFTLRQLKYCPSYLDGVIIPQSNSARYLGLHLDCKLNWSEHIRHKRDFLNLKLREYSWLIGRNSSLSLQSKRSVYSSIFKPVWTYGIELWSTAKPSNRNRLQVFQNKFLRMIASAPWYVTNNQLHQDLQLETIDREYEKHTGKYEDKLHNHCNVEAMKLLTPYPNVRRISRRYPLDTL